ncbi:MAG: hypothetical protein K2N43_09325, partial [Lachnospiraceae bacterium]|nr:hypothetical protein [Lachnospiraceae bacterium]
MEYIKLAVGLIAAFIFLSLGIYTVYTSIRDAFWPEKSTLARSIRGQLPYPDSAPKVKELFAMVDTDIGINGQWFDQIAVGKEWVLGEVASYLPRIQVFFGRDETRTRKSGNRMNTTRIIELHILDDRRQHQVMTLKNPRELQPLLDCISLRAPDAFCRPYSEISAWIRKSDMEWENILREHRVRQGEREMAKFQAGSRDIAKEQNMTLVDPNGDVTSRVTPALIHQALLDCLKWGEGTFTLTLGKPIEKNGINFVAMECFVGYYADYDDYDNYDDEEPDEEEMLELGEAELFLKMMSTGAGRSVDFGRRISTDVRTAEQILQAWLRG